MKKLFLLLYLIAGTITTYAQLGKMQYEDAEEQFAAGKYEEAIKLLDKAERSNKKSNPLISHLRIIAKTALLESGYKGYMRNSHIKNAKMEAEIFLKEHEGNADLEDKYRDVYKALNELNTYKLPELRRPTKTTDEVISGHVKMLQNVLTKYKDGMTLAEIQQIVPGEYEKLSEESEKFVTARLENIVFDLTFSPSGKAMEYKLSFSIPEENKPGCDDYLKMFSQMRASMLPALGDNPKRYKKENYIIDSWEKAEKKIDISYNCEFSVGKMIQYVMVDSDNEAIK